MDGQTLLRAGVKGLQGTDYVTTVLLLRIAGA